MDWTQEQRAAFAELMRSARMRLGLKQYEVAERLDMSPGTISQLERGPFLGMRWWDMVRLARFYQLPHEVIEATLGYDAGPTVAQALSRFPLEAELEGLEPDQREEVRRVVRLLVRGLRAKE